MSERKRERGRGNRQIERERKSERSIKERGNMVWKTKMSKTVV